MNKDYKRGYCDAMLLIAALLFLSLMIYEGANNRPVYPVLTPEEAYKDTIPDLSPTTDNL